MDNVEYEVIKLKKKYASWLYLQHLFFHYPVGDIFLAVEGIRKLTVEGDNITVSDCEYK